ncbi:MAG TPA: ROK family protein [Bacillales bacterium]|nr:ROK family protein [Bacillales bacterium]
MEQVQSDEKRFIGIDGGGTKTTCVVGNEKGEILDVVHGQSSNIRSSSLDQVKQALLDVIRNAMNQSETSFGQVAFIYFALAGSDRPEARKRIAEALRPSIADSVPLRIDNDAMGALASGTWGGPGTVLIAGTGSIAYSRYSTGRVIRVGGWGYLIGDEGSGYDVGRRGLSAVFEEFDGRGEKTLLTSFLLNKYQVSEVPDLIPIIYNREEIRGEIASLSKLVFTAASHGDSIASNIIDEATGELIELVRPARLNPEMCKAPLVLCGGLFGNEYFKNQFVGKAREQLGELQVVHPAVSPAAGAFILAMQSFGIQIDQGVRRRIEESFIQCVKKRI